MPHGTGVDVEFFQLAPEHGWRSNQLYTGGSIDDYSDYLVPGAVRAHPATMKEWGILGKMTLKDMMMKPTLVDGGTVFEVIKLQQELCFHFYYTGVDPQKGDDKDPEVWICAVIYEEKYLAGITKGLQKIGVDISDVQPEPLTEDIQEFIVQTIVHTPGAWITAHDPFMKVLMEDQLLEQGKIYHFEDDFITQNKLNNKD
mmetsp:Transcript_121699/g.190095  ORF Transcript_121699/g.190095 Transcript_121699/m.190095 type:complete len:200 (-) Transcript_121699:67-666(-)|eukprot:CAMPEP_0169122922 /NCGR_PEP_ID=MMETSP1015-20121227/33499_1 /TAXON_ID=342587 /ORGANISM="Karlodinium micrum, Strain CCMP2283" /LENGTH=199 /DNA_ID=CAMNT_0009186203 /DNA_START=54 /DNA_END=653 /DNA_ORIENTATION=+